MSRKRFRSLVPRFEQEYEYRLTPEYEYDFTSCQNKLVPEVMRKHKTPDVPIDLIESSRIALRKTHGVKTAGVAKQSRLLVKLELNGDRAAFTSWTGRPR